MKNVLVFACAVVVVTALAGCRRSDAPSSATHEPVAAPLPELVTPPVADPATMPDLAPTGSVGLTSATLPAAKSPTSGTSGTTTAIK
jgi:hypothetical protein